MIRTLGSSLYFFVPLLVTDCLPYLLCVTSLRYLLLLAQSKLGHCVSMAVIYYPLKIQMENEMHSIALSPSTARERTSTILSDG